MPQASVDVQTECHEEARSSEAPKTSSRLATAVAAGLRLLVDIYVAAVLLGVILFAGKTGVDGLFISQETGFHRWARRISRFLPQPLASRSISCEEADTTAIKALASCVGAYLGQNVPLAAVFLAQHSLLKTGFQRRLGAEGRRCYCLASALALHLFMAFYRDLDLPALRLDLGGLGVSPVVHFWFSLGIILGSYLVFLAYDHGLWAGAILTGRGQARRSKSACPANMDVITGMGIAVFEQAGWWGFLLFSGLSIIPWRTTLGDVIMRVCAAAYLRYRSLRFREVAANYRHHWHVRAGIVLGGAATGLVRGDSWRGVTAFTLVGIAVAVAAVLLAFEALPSGMKPRIFGRKPREEAKTEPVVRESASWSKSSTALQRRRGHEAVCS